MKYYQYNTDDLEAAIEAVKECNMTIRNAAKEFNLPRTTLQDYIRTGAIPGKHGGQPPYLSKEDEMCLKNYVSYMQRNGWGLSAKQVRFFAQQIAEERHGRIMSMPSDGWRKRYLERNSLSLRTVSQLEKQRAASTTHNDLTNYFKILADIMESKHIEASQVYNMDECGFGRALKNRTKIVTESGQDRPTINQVYNSQHQTVVACICADGTFMPNGVIYTTCPPTERYIEKMPKDWLYASSKSGYINSEIYEKWFGHFLLHSRAGPDRPVILIVDGHESHINLKVAEMAIANNVTIVVEPPHSSHFLQPCDMVFKHVKDAFSAECANANIWDSSVQVKKGQFANVLQIAQDKAWTPSLIKGGFRRTGVYPLNMEKVDPKWLSGLKIQQNQDNEEPSTSNEEEASQVDVCKECKRPPNILLRKGLISADLADILQPPEIRTDAAAPVKPSRRIRGCRVLTGQEMLDDLKQRDLKKTLKTEKAPKTTTVTAKGTKKKSSKPKAPVNEQKESVPSTSTSSSLYIDVYEEYVNNKENEEIPMESEENLCWIEVRGNNENDSEMHVDDQPVASRRSQRKRRKFSYVALNEGVFMEENVTGSPQVSTSTRTSQPLPPPSPSTVNQKRHKPSLLNNQDPAAIGVIVQDFDDYMNELEVCYVCKMGSDSFEAWIVCSECVKAFHQRCISEAIGDHWLCPTCRGEM